MRWAVIYFPILDWGRRYDRSVLTSDLLAAVIVTIMLIPQSLAYAMLAGLPPQVGLYASILPLVPMRSSAPAARFRSDRSRSSP
jgi:MFS superfamily sulfate permease-like transporter